MLATQIWINYWKTNLSNGQSFLAAHERGIGWRFRCQLAGVYHLPRRLQCPLQLMMLGLLWLLNKYEHLIFIDYVLPSNVDMRLNSYTVQRKHAVNLFLLSPCSRLSVFVFHRMRKKSHIDYWVNFVLSKVLQI